MLDERILRLWQEMPTATEEEVHDVMVELDRSPDTPMGALDTAMFSRADLVKLGYNYK